MPTEKTLQEIIDDSTRKAYDANWTWENQQEAFKQGWGLFTAYGDTVELQLQRLDEMDDGNAPPIFTSDEEAWTFVKATSELGDELAKKALQRLFVENVKEYDKIMGLDSGEEKH